MEINTSSWITVLQDTGDICPVFRKPFTAEKAIKKAELEITALGVYEAHINGQRVGDFVLAPGWTSYDHRLQVQTYDVTALLQTENDLRVTVGRGWFRSPMPGWLNSEDKQRRMAQPCGLIALLHLYYADGTEEIILTDESWQWAKSRILFSEIYEGDDNPMLDAYYVTVNSGAQLEEITAEIRQIPGIYKASYGEQSTVSLMEAMFNVRRFGLYFVIAMGLLAVFLISNTIKLTIAARQDEITIMRNVGATNHFIRAPFLWEGVFTGLIGALAPIGLSIWGYMAAYRQTGGILFSNMFKLSPPDPYVYYLAGVLAVLGVVVGFVGSWLSVSKYLRWKR